MTDTPAAGAAPGLTVLQLAGLQEFTADKRVRKALVKGGQIDVEMVCYEPGQFSAMHAHPRQDEIFYVVEGRVNLSIGGVEQAYEAGSMIRFGPGIPHDVRNLSNARCSIIFIKLATSLLGAVAPVAQARA